jgi:hypothetical protein
MKKFIAFISLIMIVFSVASYSQEKVAQTGCKMLDVGAGARACGMGEAYTVVGQDANALFYNPSCIGEIEDRFDLSVGATQWFADINYGYLAAVYSAGVWGNFGVSVMAPDYGDIYGAQIDTTAALDFRETGQVDVSTYSIGVAYAREFTDKFTVGAQIKYVMQHLGSSSDPANPEQMRENKISTLSYDFGLLFYPGFKSFAFGMSVRNFSPRVKYEMIGFELPLTFTLGIGADVLDYFGEHPDYSLKVGVDMLHPRDWQEEYHLGGEFGYKDMIFLRAGYKFRYSQEGWNVGAGISFAGNAKVDYSYSEFRLFDWINRVSVGMTF